MTIGILSMQQINNMGSLLQAYSLKKILEIFDAKISFIDIKKKDEDYALLEKPKQRFTEERERQGIAGKLLRIDKYALNRIRIRQMAVVQDKVFDGFRLKELEIRKIDDDKNLYDVCIIGSDEVFNCLNAGFWGFTSQLFGNIPQAKKVITYAASCGSTQYEYLPETIVSKISESFYNISAFSARDKNTEKFISFLSSKEVQLHLDPVLVYDFKDEIDTCLLPDNLGSYCIVYSYYNRIHTNDEIKAIQNFCKLKNFKIITLGAPQMWNKNFMISTPFQCLKLFKNAKFVITDTFHGTIFAAKYAARFAIIIRDSNRNKLYDLIERLDLHKHVVSSLEDLTRIYDKKKDSLELEKKIAFEKERTIKYLYSHII